MAGLWEGFRFQALDGITPSGEQVKLAKAKAAVTGLSALVHAPTLDGIDPATNEGFVSLSYKVKKGSTHDFCCGQEAVIGAIDDRA
jgi:hypothetical protein